MRKLFSTLFSIVTGVLYLANLAFLVYLIARTFDITAVLDLYAKLFATINFSLAGQKLIVLWLIYLLLCIPITALLQKYGKNLSNSDVVLPLTKTLFDILGGLLKSIFGIVALVVIIWLVFKLVIPMAKNGIPQTFDEVKSTFTTTLQETATEAVDKAVNKASDSVHKATDDAIKNVTDKLK